MSRLSFATHLFGLLLVSGGCTPVDHEPASTRPRPVAPRMQDELEELAGNVIIRSAVSGPNYEVIVDFRANGEAPDGRPDRLFVLQREPPGRRIHPIRIDEARILVQRGELLVRPPVGPYAYSFALTSPPSTTRQSPPDWPERRARFLAGRAIGQQWLGVGLIQYSGRLPLEDADPFRS